MKTNSILLAIVLTAALATSAAIAQSNGVVSTGNPAAPQAAPAVNAMPAPDQIIYLPQLPSAGSLANAAVAQGISVEQINQLSNQITVVYKYSNGQTHTICYQLLSSAGVTPAIAGPGVAAAPAQTTVIYQRPVGYYYDPYYYGWPWFAPVSVSLGFGFHGGYHGGGFHGGGFHGGHGWR